MNVHTPHHRQSRFTRAELSIPERCTTFNTPYYIFFTCIWEWVLLYHSALQSGVCLCSSYFSHLEASIFEPFVCVQNEFHMKIWATVCVGNVFCRCFVWNVMWFSHVYIHLYTLISRHIAYLKWNVYYYFIFVCVYFFFSHFISFSTVVPFAVSFSRTFIRCFVRFVFRYFVHSEFLKSLLYYILNVNFVHRRLTIYRRHGKWSSPEVTLK